MPIYEYRCKNGHTFEVFQSMSADPVTACEECGAPVERVFHPVAIHFKGSGFHNTDYKNKDKDKDKAGAATDADSGSSSDGKSDSKSDSGSSEKKSDSSKSDSGSKAKSGSSSD